MSWLLLGEEKQYSSAVQPESMEKLWCSLMSSFSVTLEIEMELCKACSFEIKKSNSLSNSTNKNINVKMRWQICQEGWMSSYNLTLCCLHPCKVNVKFYHTWIAFTCHSCAVFLHTLVCLPPFLRSDVTSKNHFIEPERGHGSVIDELLRACVEGA